MDDSEVWRNPPQPLRNAASELRWIAALLAAHKPRVKAFLDLHSTLESSILRGRYASASRTLDEIKHVAGASVWGTKTRLALLNLQSGLPAQREHLRALAETLPHSTPHLVIAFYASRRLDGPHSPEAYRDAMDDAGSCGATPQVRDYLRYEVGFLENVDDGTVASLANIELASSLIDVIVLMIVAGRRAIALGSATNAPVLLEVLTELAVDHPGSEFSIQSELLRGEFSASPARALASQDVASFIAGKGHSAFGDQQNVSTLIAHRYFLEALAGSVSRGRLLPTSQISHALQRILDREDDGTGTAAVLALASGLPSFGSSAFLASLVAHCGLMRRLPPGAALPRLGAIATAPPTPLNLLSLSRDELALKYSAMLRAGDPTMDWIATDAPLASPPQSAGRALQLLVRMRLASARNDSTMLATVRSELTSFDSRFVSIECDLRWIAHLLDNNRRAEACERLASACVRDERMANAYPLERAANAAVDEIRDPARAATPQMAIVLALASKLLTRDYDVALSFCIERLLDQQGCALPSSLPLALLEQNPTHFEYLFARTLTPAVLASLPGVTSSEEALIERIALLDSLVAFAPALTGEARDEQREISRRIALSRGAHAVARGRVFVDTGRISQAAPLALVDEFVRARTLMSLADILKDAQGKAARELDIEGVRVVVRMPDRLRETALVALVQRLRADYLSHSAHGLDGYLSTRIRHGTLLGQMRRAYDAEQLLTRLNLTSGHYAPNNHWRSRLAAISAPSLDRITNALRDFSRSFDALVEEVASEWIAIHSAERPKGMFVFPMTIEMIAVAASSVSDDSPIEEFVKRVLELLDKQLDACLANIRHRIETELQEKIAHLLVTLRSKLDAISSTLPHGQTLAPLLNAISTASTNGAHDVRSVAAWFTRIASTEHGPFTCEEALHIACEDLSRTGRACVMELKKGRAALPAWKGDKLLWFVDLFEILMENARQYSGDGAATRVTVSLEWKGKRVRVVAKNQVSKENIALGAIERVEQLKRDLRDPQFVSRAATERRSGYSKIMKILTLHLGWKHSVDVTLSARTREFVATLDLEPSEDA